MPSRSATSLPVAVDAMGGDRAPGEIVAGALRAAEKLGIAVSLVGPPGRLGNVGGLEVIPASEVIGMDEEPGAAVRRKKDSSLVRAAEAVRDKRAIAMVSAGNTGAAMASALLRMGRLRGVTRPAIATPIPNLGSTPTVLLDAGANAECNPSMLVQFAQMGAAFARARYSVSDPRVALLSIGEEPTKGSPLVKQAHSLLLDVAGIDFIGNVEGRDLLAGAADVVVTDGFTGNVALKTLEGALRFFMGTLARVLATNDETSQAAKVLWPHLAPIAEAFDPDNTGGAMLLGVDGVCVISHGSSSAGAIAAAVAVAHDLAVEGLPELLAAAVAPV
ncbi:MAG: phosphate acyltransferase PlsX [Acidimicrobiales bacterium]